MSGEKTSLEEANGVATGVTGRIGCWNADSEARLCNAMLDVGKWVVSEAGVLLGHIKAAVTLDDGTGITLNLTDMDNGVEKHGELPPHDTVNFTFMSAVLDVDEHELHHKMEHAIDDSGLLYEIDETECHCHDHHHDHEHHHHDHDECSCKKNKMTVNNYYGKVVIHHHYCECCKDCDCCDDHDDCGCGHDHHHDHDEECHCHEHKHEHEECGCGEKHHHEHDEECHCHEHHHHEHDECGCGDKKECVCDGTVVNNYYGETHIHYYHCKCKDGECKCHEDHDECGCGHEHHHHDHDEECHCHEHEHKHEHDECGCGCGHKHD